MNATAPIRMKDAAAEVAEIGCESVTPASLFNERQRWGLLAVLLLVATLNMVDRVIISVLLDPIKQEFHLSDTMLGLLSGLAFALCYAVGGIPFARWADRGNRRTVIAVALTAWSAMTIGCGLAQSWLQLLVARMGVGVAESGSAAPTQSLIADYFPAHRRATAIAFLNATGNLGYFLGIGLGGYIAAVYGWRAAFLFAGVPGLIIAVIVRLTLVEPRQRIRLKGVSTTAEPATETIARLSHNRSFLFAVVGICLYAFFGYGASVFLPSLMIRELHANLAQVSTAFGAALSASTAIGALGGGWLADRLSRRDIRWHAWLPAAGCAIAVPVYGLALLTDHFRVFVTLFCAAEAILAAGFPAIYAGIHAVCGGPRRATAFAIVFLLTTLVGSGLGPLAVGALSDSWHLLHPLHSLRYSLLIMLGSLVVAAGSFYLFGRALPHDMDDEPAAGQDASK
jgi:MFS family permease